MFAGAALGACASPPKPPPPSPPPTPPRARDDRRFLEVFERSLQDARTPGGATAVVVDGRPALIHASGLRDRRTGTPVTANTLFRLESVTKTFTAMAAMALVERGRLALDAPIVDLVPTFDAANSDARDVRAVTLRRLLDHTAGLGRNAIKRLRDVDPARPYDDT